MDQAAQRIALPDELQRFAGNIVDVDSHEMMPAQVWIKECGPVCEALVQQWLNNGEDVTSGNPNHSNCPDFKQDDAPIETDTIWKRKGSFAPGAVDMGRRDAVMDVMGVKRQLCFPTGVGMWGTFLVMFPEDAQAMPSIQGDRVAYGKQLTKAYVDWALRTRVSDRVRIVLPLFADTVEELMRSARHLIHHGIRAVWLPSALLPGGKSPAHPELDPFWTLMEQNNIAVCLHTGPDQAYKSREWGNAPVFQGFRLLSEFRCDPWTLTHNHITARNFLATMLVGAVFERHPRLRFGVIELGAYWLGELCYSLDMWYRVGAKGFVDDGKTYRLPNTPSFYLKRNVRVSPFDFEEIDTYITQYGLQDVLCFATDYPHVEGGRDPASAWYQRLKPLGTEVVEKFFVKNGQWLLPD
jgi:predicted TIM-barrel fold metal-dependent hydrolase